MPSRGRAGALQGYSHTSGISIFLVQNKECTKHLFPYLHCLRAQVILRFAFQGQTFPFRLHLQHFSSDTVVSEAALFPWSSPQGTCIEVHPWLTSLRVTHLPKGHYNHDGRELESDIFTFSGCRILMKSLVGCSGLPLMEESFEVCPLWPTEGLDA